MEHCTAPIGVWLVRGDHRRSSRIRLPWSAVLSAVEDALLALGRGEIINPPRYETVGSASDPNAFRIKMTATRFVDGSPARACTKVIEESGARDGQGRRALGSRRATLTLSEQSGALYAEMDADALTDVRTAAAALVSVRHLARRRPIRLAIIGTGRVATAAALLAEQALQLSSISATSRTEERRRVFGDRVAPALAAPLTLAGTVGDCVDGADAVVCAVPSAEPVLWAHETHSVEHLCLVGGDPRAVLADRETWLARTCYVDHPKQALATGDLIAARRQGWLGGIRWAVGDIASSTLSDAMLNRIPPPAGPTLALLTGLAALDLAMAELVVEAALRDEPPR